MQSAADRAPDVTAAISAGSSADEATEEVRRRRRAERIMHGAESRLRRIEGVEERRGDSAELPTFAASAAAAAPATHAAHAPASVATPRPHLASSPVPAVKTVVNSAFFAFSASPRCLHVGFTLATVVAGLLLWADKRCFLGVTPLHDSMWPAFLAVNLLHLAVTMTGHLASLEAFCPGLLCQLLYCVAWLQPRARPYAILLARMLGCLCFVVYLGAAYVLALLLADWLADAAVR